MPLTGQALDKAKESLKTGQTAIDKLKKDCKTLMMKLANKDDDLFQELQLCQQLTFAFPHSNCIGAKSILS